LLSTGIMISESTSAPIDTKNDRKIHNATEVSAEVAMPLKQIEKSMRDKLMKAVVAAENDIKKQMRAYLDQLRKMLDQ